MFMLSKKCIKCGEVFYKKIVTSQEEWIKAKYCSQGCYHSHKRKIIKCKICNKSFTVKRSMATRLRTCSPECKSKWRSKLSKDIAKIHGSPMNRGNARINSSRTYKRKYAEGKMDYMKKIWKNQDWKGRKNPRWVPIGSIKKGWKNRKKIKIAEGCWQPHHRYLMEQKLGRKLRSDEVVHHINQDKTDDRIENLQLLSDTEHRSFHMKERYKK